MNKGNKGKTYQNLDEVEAYYNVLMVTGRNLLKLPELKILSIESLTVYPVELKSHCDLFNVRLPNQIMNGILTFGKSVVDFIDKKHINKASFKFLRLLPATIIGYTGTKDFFTVLSVFDRNIKYRNV